jgi:hypothetical protein
VCAVCVVCLLRRLVLGGDRSAWDRAVLMPHYTAAGMPLVSSVQVRARLCALTRCKCRVRLLSLARCALRCIPPCVLLRTVTKTKTTLRRAAPR